MSESDSVNNYSFNAGEVVRLCHYRLAREAGMYNDDQHVGSSSAFVMPPNLPLTLEITLVTTDPKTGLVDVASFTESQYQRLEKLRAAADKGEYSNDGANTSTASGYDAAQHEPS